MKDGFEEKAREVLEQVGWDPDEIAERVISRALRAADSEAYERGLGDLDVFVKDRGEWKTEAEALAAAVAKKDEALKFARAEILKNDPKATIAWLDEPQYLIHQAIALTPSDAASILAKRDAAIWREAGQIARDMGDESPEHTNLGNEIGLELESKAAAIEAKAAGSDVK